MLRNCSEPARTGNWKKSCSFFNIQTLKSSNSEWFRFIQQTYYSNKTFPQTQFFKDKIKMNKIVSKCELSKVEGKSR